MGALRPGLGNKRSSHPDFVNNEPWHQTAGKLRANARIFAGSGLDKKTLSEADICEKFITPAIQQAGWNTIEWIEREYNLKRQYSPP